MKIAQTFAIAMAIALVACVSHAGLFDAIKSVANEAANVADGATKVSDAATKAPDSVAPQTSSDDQARAEFARRRKQEAEAREARIKSQTKRQNCANGVVRNGVVGVRQDNDIQTDSEQPLKEIDRFLNEELAKDFETTFPHRNRAEILEAVVAYVRERDRTLGVVGMCRSGAPDAGFRDVNGGVVGIGLFLQERRRDSDYAKKISRAWVEYAKSWLALRKAIVPMNEFLNGDFKRRLRDLDKKSLEVDDKYTAHYLAKNAGSAFARCVQELNKSFDPQWSVFMNRQNGDGGLDIIIWEKEEGSAEKGYATWNGNQEDGKGWSFNPVLWLNPSVVDQQTVTEVIAVWKKKFDEWMKPKEERVNALRNAADKDERDFVAFIKQLGEKSNGSTNAFVGVEVYKGVRLGMTERDFHKIESSGCSDAQFCGKNLRYPSAKKNTIVPSGGSIPVIDVYLGGLDLSRSIDEARKNFIVTRVEFVIKNAAQEPGISAIEKQFADRFEGKARIEKTIRKMPRGVSAAAEQDPKVQKASARVAKYRRKAKEYMLTNTTPPEKFMVEFKAAEAEVDAALAPYSIVEKYPVIRMGLAGQVVELTQPNLTQDIQVTAIYEEAESQLATLRLELEEKARKSAAENAKKAALDF